ncbi:MAG: hypothetical protein FJ271_06020 [Planctomycetes bacterium]|nr:hypothetical protein [Planctomycetota bacterium]
MTVVLTVALLFADFGDAVAQARRVSEGGVNPRSRVGLVQDPGAGAGEYRYLRVTAKGKTNECNFVVTRNDKDKGWSIVSVTGALTVSARYDVRDQLLAADVTQAAREKKLVASFRAGASLATITLADGKKSELKVPPAGVIVTSAPDWTDVFLMCRRYDRTKVGKQSFPGIWLHPSKDWLRLTFTIERVGKDNIEVDGKKRMADRFVIHLRNKSEYTAWADENGLLLRLRPGSKGEPAYELLLEVSPKR